MSWLVDASNKVHPTDHYSLISSDGISASTHAITSRIDFFNLHRHIRRHQSIPSKRQVSHEVGHHHHRYHLTRRKSL